MRNDNCKKKLLDHVSNVFFLLFFDIHYIVFNCQTEYLPYSLILSMERR